MTKNPKDDVSQIADFVKKDTEAAFDILSEKELRIRLEKRMKHELQNRSPQGLFRLKWSWVFAGALTFFLLVAIPLFILKDSAGEHKAHTAIENFLQGTPGVRALKEWQQLNRMVLSVKREAESSFISQIRQSYDQTQREALTTPPVVLNQTGKDSGGDSDTSEKLGRMLRERSIFRFLSKYSKHLEEEKNG